MITLDTEISNILFSKNILGKYNTFIIAEALYMETTALKLTFDKFKSGFVLKIGYVNWSDSERKTKKMRFGIIGVAL